jgi:hypothetical protein
MKLKQKESYKEPTETHSSMRDIMVYPKVSGLAAWSENCKQYGSLPQGAVASLFCESV